MRRAPRDQAAVMETVKVLPYLVFAQDRTYQQGAPLKPVLKLLRRRG